MNPADFLGCGYRVVVPVPAAAPYAEAQAREVLARCGIAWSDWPALGPLPVEVTGGAPYDVGRRAFGPTQVRVTPLAPATSVADAVAVDLPWWWSSDGPLAGLPTVSGLEATLASRVLEPGQVGLWWNHRDELCTSTAGPLLLRLDDGWVHPDDTAGAAPSWAWAEEARRLDARPTRVDRSTWAAARRRVAISWSGDVIELAEALPPSP